MGGCYAKIPAAIYIDMQMFKIDKPEDCACGISLDAKNDAPTLVANTNHVFQLHDAEVLSVSFIVWDIENGVKLRDISSFALAPSINTADYLATLLTNAASAVRHLAGFYGHVNDFNPGDWIVNRTREVTMMCFATVTTYYETTGNKYTCNENLVQGDILAVPLCDAQGLLDEEGYTATYPERIWREIPTPRFNYEVAAGSSNPNGNGPGGSHPTDWYNFEGLVNCQPRCQGQYCSNGGCVDCRDFNDCGLLFSPASTYSKVCNQTAQCNYVFLSPEKSKKEDSKAIIAVASVVGLIALIAVVVGVLFFVKRYRASEAAFQTKLDETENAESMLGSSPLYEGQTTMGTNPLAAQK